MVFTWINNRAGWHFVFTFSPFSTVRVRLCLRWTASKLSFWTILVFCDKLGRLYFWSLFKAVQYNLQVLHILTGTEDMTHGYWGYDSWVLHILTGTEDMANGYCIPSWVLRIWLRGTEDMTHGYCIPSRELMIWLTGNAYPHGYCIPSRVLHIVYTGWTYSL